MVKQTGRLLVILWLLGQSLLTAGGTPGVATPPKKEVWNLLRKIKQASLQHPVVTTLGITTTVAATAYLATVYASSGFKKQKNSTPVNKKIQATVKLNNKQHLFKEVPVSETLAGLLSNAIKILDPNDDNPAYEYNVTYNGTKLDGTVQKQTLEALGIKDNAVIQISIDKQPISLIVTYGDLQLKIDADKRNTFGWLKEKLHKLVDLPIDQQKLHLNAGAGEETLVPTDSQQLFSQQAFINLLTASDPQKRIIYLVADKDRTTPLPKNIQLSFQFGAQTHNLPPLDPSSVTVNDIRDLAKKKLNLPHRKYLYFFSYNGQPIPFYDYPKKLERLDIPDQSVLQLVVRKDRITLYVRYKQTTHPFEIGLIDTFRGLQIKIDHTLGIPIKNQQLLLGVNDPDLPAPHQVGDYEALYPHYDRLMSNDPNKHLITLKEWNN